MDRRREGAAKLSGVSPYTWSLLELGPLPGWCRVTTMDEYRRGRHDKVRNDLRQILTFDESSWEHRGNNWVLKMPDHNAANRLRRDVPDYVLGTGNVGNLVVFDAGDVLSSL